MANREALERLFSIIEEVLNTGISDYCYDELPERCEEELYMLSMIRRQGLNALKALKSLIMQEVQDD